MKDNAILFMVDEKLNAQLRAHKERTGVSISETVRRAVIKSFEERDFIDSCDCIIRNGIVEKVRDVKAAQKALEVLA